MLTPLLWESKNLSDATSIPLSKKKVVATTATVNVDVRFNIRLYNVEPIDIFVVFSTFGKIIVQEQCSAENVQAPRERWRSNGRYSNVTSELTLKSTGRSVHRIKLFIIARNKILYYLIHCSSLNRIVYK